MFIYLDESGDLGFDFAKRGTSRYFVITLLVTSDKKPFELAVRRTLKNKLNRKKIVHLELKGTNTPLPVKRYFLRQLSKSKARCKIYTVILNKSRVYDYLRREPEILYAYLSKFILQKCPWEKFKNTIIFVIDKRSKNQQVLQFNRYLLSFLKTGSTTAKTEIFHKNSREDKGLQAVDLFCWGIARKYEKGDPEWYNAFKHVIASESVYLPQK
jgi:hypothetical protein